MNKTNEILKFTALNFVLFCFWPSTKVSGGARFISIGSAVKGLIDSDVIKLLKFPSSLTVFG